jgi:hypothetical protein
MAKKSAPAPAGTTAAAGPINLEPRDWFLAPWRKLAPLPRPEAEPFDLKSCLARLAKVNTYGGIHTWIWDRANLADTMSREEAHFWLVAMTNTGYALSADLGARISKQKFDGKLSLKQLRTHLEREQVPSQYILFPLANLFAPAEFYPLLRDGRAGQLGEHWAHDYLDLRLAEGFARWVLPYLTEADKAALRPVVQPFTDPRNWDQRLGYPGEGQPVLGAYLAAQIGMSEELLAVVSSWPDTHSDMAHLLFGLGSARLVLYHMRRLKGRLHTNFLMRGWLAHTELAGLDVFRDTILAGTNKKHTEAMLQEIIALVRAPELAPIMLELRLGSKASAVAGQWLDDNLDLAVAGLPPVAEGQGKLADAARQFLHDASLKGGAGAPTPAPAATTPPPEWLATALASTSAGKSKLPSWADPVVFPPLRAGDYTLGRDQVRALLESVQKSTLEAPLPLVTAIKERADREGLDAFVWKLFELWQGAGCPAKEKWAFHAVGHLGGDAAVMKLTPMIRAWPGENQHARAVIGLEVLRAIGTDLALIQLNGIAQKLKFQALKNKAQEFMEAIAKDRGLSREQLGDRIVPTLDLDADGSRTFDFGPRQFRLVLDDELRPMVRDEAGAVKADLPKAGKSDDAERAAEAIDNWKVLKKQLKEIVSIQVARLEQAMVVGRRWTVPEFETLLVGHPLMRHLVQRLLWGGYDKSGKLTHTFRVAEDRSYLDLKGKPCKLAGLAAVGIVHPYHVGEPDRTNWRRVFEVAGLVAPFAQLDRPVYRLVDDEAAAGILTRFATASVTSASLKNALEKGGWVRGYVDQGSTDGHSLYFPGADLTALIHYHPGLFLSGFGYEEGQTSSIREVFFTRGQAQYHERSVATVPLLRLGEVDPVVVSEVLLFLTKLTGGA